jgi:hypothetical protein
MTQDEIIKMARQTGMVVVNDEFSLLPFLVAFAKLVEEKATEKANARANASWTLMCEKMVAFEREACAKMFDGAVWAYDYREIAAAIRARGEQA